MAIIVQPAPDADTENMLRDCGKESPGHAGRVYSVKGKRGLRPAGHRAGPLSMGTALAEELLKDYSGNIEGKTVGILSETLIRKRQPTGRKDFSMD